MKRRRYLQADRGGTFTDTGARRAVGRLPAPGLLPDDPAHGLPWVPGTTLGPGLGAERS
jgi:hypothetical protein